MLPVWLVSPWDLRTPYLNDRLYGRVADDPDIDSLSDSIRRDGVISPLVINRQGVIISGNRRCVAACRAGIDTVPCLVRDEAEDSPEFARLLVECNEQRRKDASMLIGEYGMKANGGEAPAMWLAAQRLKAESRRFAGSIVDCRADGPTRRRKAITRARAFADAVVAVTLEKLAAGIHPSVRQIHYLLLNDPPVKDSRTGERYRNDEASYNALTNLAARLRVNGELPFDAFTDAARTLRNPMTFRGAADYMKYSLDTFGGDYRRNYMASQGAFFTVAVEKEAEAALLENHLIEKYPGTPLMVCKGFSSVTATYDLVRAFRESGKETMVIVMLTDCDPCGDNIAKDIGEKLLEIGLQGDEFSLVRAGLTHEQARQYGAKPQPIKCKGKAGKTAAQKFKERHGTEDVYELEAIPPEALLRILNEAMQCRMDIEAYNAEVEADERDAEAIRATRRKLIDALKPGGDCR